MELLALVIINLLFAVVLYYAVSIKVTNSVKEYQSKKFKADMNRDILSFYKESESYLAQMDSRIVILRNLIQKAEALNLPKEETFNADSFKRMDPERIVSKKILRAEPELETNGLEEAREEVYALGVNHEYLKNEFVQKKEIQPKVVLRPSVKKENQTEKPMQEPMLLEFITGIGKGMKSLFGMRDPVKIEEVEKNYPQQVPKSTISLDYSVGGDPFEEQNKESTIKNNSQAENTFAKVLSSVQNPQEAYYHTKKDEIKISASTALNEIPEGSTRIEKVVFLLKKNYSHAEIASELGIAVPEVSLIETIKLDRRGILS